MAVIKTVYLMFVRGLRAIGRRWRWIAAGVVLAAVWVRFGPLPVGLLTPDPRPSTIVADRHGTVLYETRSPSGLRSLRVDATTLPEPLATATIAAEDARFRRHFGVDPIAVVRAAWRNFRTGRVSEGGSTITQQVVKLLLARRDGATPKRTWTSKISEAIIALRLEQHLTKNQILALYLSLAPYGNQIEGAERAAQAYFGRSATTLTPAEAAFLAALPQQPTRYNPWRDPKPARARQARILRAMRDRGWLQGTDYDTARRETLAFSRESRGALAPHFVEHVLAATPAERPRRIDTTLDAPLQRTVQGILAASRAGLDRHRAYNVAAVVLDNRTGEWLAWEGSGDYFDQQHGGTIDGVTTPRQPGSALKPFTYAAAFERSYHPGRAVADVPSQFPTADPGVMYSPRNYDGQFRGPLLVRAALAGSENVPAVAVASDIGVPAVLRMLRRSGFTTLDRTAAHYGLGLTLGNAEVRLDEMVAAYSMMARGGAFLAPRSVRAVDGRPVAAAAATRLLSERTAFWITDILSDAEARAYVFGRGGSLEFPFTVAAKTGTSQAYHDNWAIGYTADVTVGVWVGNFDRTPLANSSGVTGAGPIFHEVMMAAVERVKGYLPIDEYTPISAPTADVERATLCAVSGLTATGACPRRVTEWVPAGVAIDDCTWHHATDHGVLTVWPEPYRHWARTAGLLNDSTPAPAVRAIKATAAAPATTAGTLRASANHPPLSIVAPLAGAVYLFDPTLRPEFQTLPLRAQGATGRLEWFVNQTSIGTTRGDETMRWPISRGTHEIQVRDGAGRSAETKIVVR